MAKVYQCMPQWYHREISRYGEASWPAQAEISPWRSWEQTPCLSITMWMPPFSIPLATKCKERQSVTLTWCCAKDLQYLGFLMNVTRDNLHTPCHALPWHALLNKYPVPTVIPLVSPEHPLFLFLSFCFSPSLGLLGHGATQNIGCFGELHEGWLDRGEVSCDLVHGPLAGTGSVWGGEGLQVFLGVWGSPSKPDTELCGGEDGQGEGFSLGQQLVLPHPSFHGAHSEDTRGAGLHQRTGLPLPRQSLPTRGVIHVHCLPAGKSWS